MGPDLASVRLLVLTLLPTGDFERRLVAVDGSPSLLPMEDGGVWKLHRCEFFFVCWLEFFPDLQEASMRDFFPSSCHGGGGRKIVRQSAEDCRSS
jgi:hypothetical protein